MFLEEREVTPLPVFTPTKWQTLVLRNYGLVPAERIARTIGTDEATVIKEAKRLGLEKISYDKNWQKYGYINIIKNNWHLVPYSQLLTLVDMDEETLDYCLKEDDFLWVKLGRFKSILDEVRYEPLNDEEIAETERIASIIRSEFIDGYTKPFKFYGYVKSENGQKKRAEGFDNIVYNYSTLYGDTLYDGEDIVTDEQLEALASVGVTGLWMQGVLSKLSPYPFAEGFDEGYEIRRENLRKLIDKCEKYGIGIYLYLNEPRGVVEHKLTPLAQKVKGRFRNGSWSLCTKTQPVQDYLFNAVKGLVEAAPKLKGIITITCGENMTNCHYANHNDCPICKDMKSEDVVPEVNNIIQRAIDAAGAKTRLLANLWSWDVNHGWTEEGVLEGIARLDKKIEILVISEKGTVYNRGNKYMVGEYSLSKVGPCEESKALLTYSRDLGHKVMAKIQINNSWEMAIVPYVPVFELVLEHISNLKDIGVEGFMGSWTLGGYPTVSLDLVNRFFADGFDYDEWLRDHFGELAEVVKEASHNFSEGFRHYPFSVATLYRSAHAVGPSNILYEKSTGYGATMVTFPFDDYTFWRKNSADTNEEFLEKIDALLCEWKKGLDLIEGIDGNDKFKEFSRFAKVIYVNMKSTALQMRYNIARDEGRVEELPAFLREERALARELYSLAAIDARIGYEASCHYYFTQNNFLEKFINLDALERRFDKKA